MVDLNESNIFDELMNFAADTEDEFTKQLVLFSANRINELENELFVSQMETEQQKYMFEAVLAQIPTPSEEKDIILTPLSWGLISAFLTIIFVFGIWRIFH